MLPAVSGRKTRTKTPPAVMNKHPQSLFCPRPTLAPLSVAPVFFLPSWLAASRVNTVMMSDAMEVLRCFTGGNVCGRHYPNGGASGWRRRKAGGETGHLAASRRLSSRGVGRGGGAAPRSLAHRPIALEAAKFDTFSLRRSCRNAFR